MAQAIVWGWVTTGLELKTSVRNNPYVMFSLAEHIGYGETARTSTSRYGRGDIWRISW